MPLKFFAKYLPKEKVIGDKTKFATRGTLKWSENVSNKINYTPIQFAISNPGNPLQFFFEGVEDEIVSHARKLCLTNASSLIWPFNQDYHDLNFHNISKSFIVSLEHSGKLRWVSYKRHI